MTTGRINQVTTVTALSRSCYTSLRYQPVTQYEAAVDDVLTRELLRKHRLNSARNVPSPGKAMRAFWYFFPSLRQTSTAGCSQTRYEADVSLQARQSQSKLEAPDCVSTIRYRRTCGGLRWKDWLGLSIRAFHPSNAVAVTTSSVWICTVPSVANLWQDYTATLGNWCRESGSTGADRREAAQQTKRRFRIDDLSGCVLSTYILFVNDFIFEFLQKIKIHFWTWNFFEFSQDFESSSHFVLTEPRPNFFESRWILNIAFSIIVVRSSKSIMRYTLQDVCYSLRISIFGCHTEPSAVISLIESNGEYMYI